MRRRFIQIDGELHEVTEDYVAPPRSSSDSVLWNDRAYQNLNDPRFKSRSEHREYMKRHSLTTIDDFKDTWRRAEQQRLNVRKGVDPSRKQDLVNAIQKVQQGYKPQRREP